MNTRKNPLINLLDASSFQTKPPRPQPMPAEEIERIAEKRNFPSREPRTTPSAPARQRRVYRTGRNRHLGIKATNEAVERFYKMADERRVPLGELLQLALDALEREAAGRDAP